MIINNFNLVRIVFLPAEADTPLGIDPNAPLAAPTAFERFQSSARKCSQVSQPLGIVQHAQLSQCYRLHRVIQSPRESAMPETLCLFAGKACDHRTKLSCSLQAVNSAAPPHRWRRLIEAAPSRTVNRYGLVPLPAQVLIIKEVGSDISSSAERPRSIALGCARPQGYDPSHWRERWRPTAR